MALLLGADVAFSTGAGSFTDPSDMTWHSLYWTGGTAFAGQGYADTNVVPTWPSETGSSALTQGVAADQPVLTAALAGLNNQPAVAFDTSDWMSTGTYAPAVDYSAGVSVVCVFSGLGVGGATYGLHDGKSSGGRMFLASSSNLWALTSGSVISGGTPTSGAHMSRCFYSGASGGNESIYINEALIATGDGGNQEATGLTLAAAFNASNKGAPDVALIGIYEGDISADAFWSDFTAWVTAEYGISL